MATSGSFTTASYETRNVKFNWWVISQSIEGNYTKIGWNFVGGGTGNIWYYTKNGYLNINGTRVYTGSDSKIQLYVGTVLASGETTIYHNADGTKSFSADGGAMIYTYGSYKTGSGTWSLPAIARASQPSCITWPNTTEDIGNIGNTITIHTNRKSTSFTHTVRYIWYDKSGTIATNVTTNCQFTIPMSFCDNLPNASIGQGTIYVDTKNGSTTIGTKSVTFKAHVPENSETKPTISLSVSSDNTSIPSEVRSIFDGMYIQKKSKVSAQIAFSFKHGATLKSLITSVESQNYSGSTVLSDILSLSGNRTVNSTVTDTRNFTATDSKSITVYEYDSPKVIPLTSKNEVECFRSNESGAHTNNSTKIWLSAQKSFYSLDGKNSCSLEYRYKLSSESWSNQPWSTLQTVNNEFNGLLSMDFPVINAYTIQVRAIDILTDSNSLTDIISFDVPTDDIPIHLGAGGKSVGIGTYADTTDDYSVRVGWKINFLGEVYFDGVKADYIIEQGTSGIWVYRKWASGTAECWGISPEATVTGTDWAAWGTLFTASVLNNTDFPFVFYKLPQVFVSLFNPDTNTNGWIASRNEDGKPSTTQTGAYQIVRPTALSGSEKYQLQIYAIGLWK